MTLFILALGSLAGRLWNASRQLISFVAHISCTVSYFGNIEKIYIARERTLVLTEADVDINLIAETTIYLF